MVSFYLKYECASAIFFVDFKKHKTEMKEKNEMNSATWLNRTPHIIRTIYLPAT